MTTPSRSNAVLIVDDQKEIHDDFRDVLTPAARRSTDDLASSFLDEDERPGLPEMELLHAMSGEEAFDLVRTRREAGHPIAVAFVDVRMPPGMSGIEAVNRIREVDRELEVVIMTAYTSERISDITNALDLIHKSLFIRKPFSREEIRHITLSLLEKWNVERELAEKRRQQMIGQQRLEAVLDATGDAIAMVDLDGRLAFANRSYEEILGLQEDRLKELSAENLAARAEQRLSHLTDIEGVFTLEAEGILDESSEASGEKLVYRSTMPVVGPSSERLGDLVVYRDVSEAIEAERMRTEVHRLRSELATRHPFSNIVGSSRAMHRVFGLMKKAAESDITVLLRGESGTGKELVARALHEHSVRSEGPFLAVNCAAIPETLIESELFGHERGAFTGAGNRRIGVFERARGGTVLLDEIGDMETALQTRLLRVLEELKVQRVGGADLVPVDVRVIAATNRAIEDAVADGGFREDLYHRIAAFPIELPPLRERREDIPALANVFLRKHGGGNGEGAAVRTISAAALSLLLRYDWPGNVRELENAIRRGVLLGTGEALEASDLPDRLWPRSGAADEAPGAVLPLAEVERRALLYALEVAGENVTRAAELLGINRATLYRKLKKYGRRRQG